MITKAILLQAGLLICSAAAIALTTRSSIILRRIGAAIGVFGQVFWFMWLDPAKDFGAFALAVWFLVVYAKVLYDTFHPKRIFVVKLRFSDPDRLVRLKVLASSDQDIVKAHIASGMMIGCQMEIYEPEKEVQHQMDLKKFTEELLHQQRIQQSEKVRV